MSGFAPALWMTLGGTPGVLQALQNSTNPNASGGAVFTLKNNGDLEVGDGTGLTDTYQWVLPASAGIAAGYQVRADVVSGALTSGTTGVYLALTSNRAWTRTGVLQTCTLRIRIADLSGVVRLDQNVVLTST